MRPNRGARLAISLSIAVVTAAAGIGVSAAPAAASGRSNGPRSPAKLGRAYQIPRTPGHPGRGASFTAQKSPAETMLAAASAQAARTHRPVPVAGLTTQTGTVTASPSGLFTSRDYALPVRVRQGRNWAAVSTSLRRVAGGMLAAAAVPGDQVTFSGGGRGPMAEIAAPGARLALWWPGPLPRPVVSGSSATYRVLPGVDLVLTATSAETGGFREVLVIADQRAATMLGSVALRVTGDAALRATSDGGLIGPAADGGGYFMAAPPLMWDSSAAPAGHAANAGRPVPAPWAAEMQRAGAWRAPPGSAPASSAAGPGNGALVARVAARLSAGGTVLRLVPDPGLLFSAASRYPVYVDPTLWLNSNGGGTRKAYDPVQSDAGNSGLCRTFSNGQTFCDTTDCRGSHYDWASYYDSPVGYNDYEAGPCQFVENDRALYQVGVSEAIQDSGVHLVSATVQASVSYSSDCYVNAPVTLSWIGGFNEDTGWPGPYRTNGNTDATATFPPDTVANNGGKYDSCSNSSVKNDGALVSRGFNVLADMEDLTGSTFSFRLWEPQYENNNDIYHVQITNNPYLQVQFFQSPDTPSPASMHVSATSAHSNPKVCSTNASSAPTVQASQANGGVYVDASFTTADGHSNLQGNISYSKNGDNSGPPVIHTPDVSPSDPDGWATIPWSWLKSFTAPTTIVFQAQAQTGTASVAGRTYGPYYSGWSGLCYFNVIAGAIAGPTVTTNFTQATPQTSDQPASFTLKAPTGYTPSDFVWGLDGPAVNNCTTATPASTCRIAGTGATLTIIVPSPGPHVLSVYEKNTDATTSETSQDLYIDPQTGKPEAWTFLGAGDPPVSFTAQSSLAGNFADALGHSMTWDNTMISRSNQTSCGAASGDGGGTNLSATDLAGAGWGAGTHVTVDGAAFTLPSYGSCGPDNLLAANQSLGAGGAHGSALVFLAASSDGFVDVPGLMTGAPGSSPLQGDHTAPAVGGGATVTGSGCLAADNYGTICVPATGSVNYGAGPAGSTCPTSASYTLTTPDWWEGPSDIAAVTLPHIVNTSGQTTRTVKLYAFAVPLYGQCPLDSVTLPDVGATVHADPASGVGSIPGLHIFGVAIRNTTTATPALPGAACLPGCVSPSGNGWTGAFEQPVEDGFGPPAGYTWGNQTMRIAISPGIAAAAGSQSQVRIRLTDPGFLSADGTGPLQIGAATIAPDWGGPVPAQAPVALKFGGQPGVTVPEGGDVYSDPLPLQGFGVTPGKLLLISIWIKNTSLPVLPVNSLGAGAVTWFAPSSTPDQTQDTTGTPFTGPGSTWIGAVPLLAGVDVTTAAPSPALSGPNGQVATAGAPTVVVAGNSVTDGWTAAALSDTLNSPSRRLAGQIGSQGLAPGYGVVDAGIEGNQLIADAAPGGVGLVARLDRDILAEPGVGTVVIDQGLQDLLRSAADQAACVTGATACPLVDAYSALLGQLNAFGINVIAANLTPCFGYQGSAAADPCTTTATESSRLYLNDQLATSLGGQTFFPYCPADFDHAVTDGANPEHLATTPANFDAGDHVNLSWAGYAALAPAAQMNFGCLGPPLPGYPLPVP